MEIRLWGVRGSLPSPHPPALLDQRFLEIALAIYDARLPSREAVPEFIQSLGHHRLGGYGGNTPCVEVRQGATSVIIDGGSGIRALGEELLSGPAGQGKAEIHLLMTHFHWDHLIGLPFFAPIFVPGNQIHVHAVQPDLPEIFAKVFSKPYFPVPFGQLAAKFHFHRLEPRKSFQLGDLKLVPYQLDHPDPCWGYRIEGGGRTYAHCVDTECRRITREDLGADLPLYQGVNLMVFDAQYTLLETIEKVNWGHAAAGLGLDLAMREGIERVLFMHHDPASADERIATVEAQTRRYYESALRQSREGGEALHEVQWAFAREGQTIPV